MNPLFWLTIIAVFMIIMYVIIRVINNAHDSKQHKMTYIWDDPMPIMEKRKMDDENKSNNSRKQILS